MWAIAIIIIGVNIFFIIYSVVSLLILYVLQISKFFAESAKYVLHVRDVTLFPCAYLQVVFMPGRTFS